MIKILSISRGEVRHVQHGDKQVSTGIYKYPVQGRVRVSGLGIDGDTQVDRKNHGGPDKALYVYSVENYHHWCAALGVDTLEHGYFGENLTVSSMPDDAVHIGDIFRFGKLRVQVTQPRVPCFKLGIRVGRSAFVEEFLKSGRVGFYVRVLEPGELEAGDPITQEVADPHRVSIQEAMQALLKGPRQQEFIRKVLAVDALSAAWQEDLGQRLKSV